MQVDGSRFVVPSDDPTITEQEIAVELERILSDPNFRSTERNKKFLRYVTERLLQGQEDKVKAYSIAVDVFGRPETFDPAIDPIVRIEATRLRASLAQYYELHGRDGGLRIDLQKGRYVPAISRLDPIPGRGPAPVSPPGRDTEAPDTDEGPRSSRLKSSAGPLWAAVSIGAVGGLLLGAAFLFHLFGQQQRVVISEKPSVTIDMRAAGDDFDGGAQKLRDALMVALSRFRTLKILETPTTPVDMRPRTPGASRRGSYEIALTYRRNEVARSVWWKIIDLHSGEVLISRSEAVPVGEFPAPARTLAGRLAIRIAGFEGVINNIEMRREIANPTLGNGCVLRSHRALRSLEPAALTQARTCLEQTLERRPGDADAQAVLSGVLLAVDTPEAPTELSVRALELADSSAALAPHSALGAVAQMAALFRSGHIEAAILAGRRAVSLNPNDSEALAGLGGILCAIGRWEEGMPLVMKADRMDGPPDRNVDITLAMDAYRRGAFDEALARLRRPDDAPCCDVDILRTAALGQLGRRREAEAAAEALRKADAGFETSFRTHMAARHFESGFVSLLAAGLSKAGLHIQ